MHRSFVLSHYLSVKFNPVLTSIFNKVPELFANLFCLLAIPTVAEVQSAQSVPQLGPLPSLKNEFDLLIAHALVTTIFKLSLTGHFLDFSDGGSHYSPQNVSDDLHIEFGFIDSVPASHQIAHLRQTLHIDVL